MPTTHAPARGRRTILSTIVGVSLVALAGTTATASAAIDLSPNDIQITDIALTAPGAASWSFSFGLLKTDSALPADASLLRVQLNDSATLRPLHGRGSVAGAAGQDRFTAIPTAPDANPLFRQGGAFLALDAHDPDWAQIVKDKKARLSVAISISADVVTASGNPLASPLTDDAVAHGTATVTIPRSVLRAHRH
jgi:hypothetical protein